jgi:hypothetical protein
MNFIECGKCANGSAYMSTYNACPGCEETKIDEKHKQLDLNMVRIEARLAELVLSREQSNTEIHKISANNQAILDITSTHNHRLNTIDKQLEYLTTMMSRLTKSVATMLDKKEE